MPTGLNVLIKHQEIQREVAKLAYAIRRDYMDKDPLLIGILKGLFISPYSMV